MLFFQHLSNCHYAGCLLGSCPCAQIIGAFPHSIACQVHMTQGTHKQTSFLPPGQLNLMLHNYHLKHTHTHRGKPSKQDSLSSAASEEELF